MTTKSSFDDLSSILLHVGINPDTVYSVTEISSTCQWCNRECGHIAVLNPCEHTICSQCLDSIIDSRNETCPHCQESFFDFQWR